MLPQPKDAFVLGWTRLEVSSELDPRWLSRVSKLSSKGWKNLVAMDQAKIKEMRGHIQALAGETGLEIGEFRKIV